MIEYIIISIFAFALGYSIAARQQIVTPKDEGVIEALRKEIEYYKDLCLWHVEEKEKLKQEHYIK